MRTIGAKSMKFDPREWNFIKLEDFEIPGGVEVYEYKNHLAVNGKADFLRLNLFLTRDKDFVTIWFGLLERYSHP